MKNLDPDSDPDFNLENDDFTMMKEKVLINRSA